MIRRRGRVLLVQRQETGLLGGFWELPGGDATDQPDARAAAAAMRRQTGLTVSDLSVQGELTHVFSHFRLQLALFTCRRATGRLRTNSPVRLHWASNADLDRLPVATAHRRALRICGRSGRKA